MRHASKRHCSTLLLIAVFSAAASAQSTSLNELPGTQPLLDLALDPAAEMVAGIDRFALEQIAVAAERRNEYWQTPASLDENRRFLKSRLGLPLERSPVPLGGLLYEVDLASQEANANVRQVRWPVLAHPAKHLEKAVSLWGEGLFIGDPRNSNPLVIVLPDADETAEQYLGLATDKLPALEQQRQIVQQFLRNGMTILIPQSVSRTVIQHGNANLSRREYLHRAAFELGRTLVGYEIGIVQAAMDQFPNKQLLVCGFGEGAMTALYAGALDERISTTICCGYFGPRDASWQEPLCRNLFGVFERFADAELGAMIGPRKLIVSQQPTYAVNLQAVGGAPSEWTSPNRVQVETEFARMLNFANDRLRQDKGFATLLPECGENCELAQSLLESLDIALDSPTGNKLLEDSGVSDQAAARELRLQASIDAHTQSVLEESDYARSQFLNIGSERANNASGSNAINANSEEEYRTSIEPFRKIFSEEIIGKFKHPLLPMAAKTKQAYQGEGWTGYEVVLDVVPDVFAYGVLLLPDDIAKDEQRPVIVCQHGLEGRPQDTMFGDHYAYHDFAARLAERGFIVFAPQNPYIGQDNFRTLQRKLNPIGKTLFSVIVSQHEQILNWLSSLPQVDPDRIAFYGLSYGGKSAMRLPAVLPRYCLSICSADFNDWVWKNASTRSPFSYVGTGEYEIFEFNLGHTFNYAEMAALIAPRPFMVERGHFDGVAPDDRVAKEFAKVRFLYAARLTLPERCAIEWFKGPHTIHGQGTFAFLHQHLGWPTSTAASPTSPPAQRLQPPDELGCGQSPEHGGRWQQQFH